MSEQVTIKSNHRQQIISKFKDEMRLRPELSVGFSLFWIWIWIVCQSDLLSQTLKLGATNLPSWAVPLFAYALGFFFLGALFKVKRIVPHGKGYIAFIIVSMTSGAFFLTLYNYVGFLEGEFREAILLICGLLMGFGTAGMHVEWGRVFGSRGTHAMIIHGIVGTLGAALLYAIMGALPPLAVSIFAVCIPSLCILTLRRSFIASPKLYRYGKDVKPYVPWKFIITSLIHGVSFGAMWTVLLLIDTEGSFMTINSLSFAVAAVCVFVTALLFKMDFNNLIYRVAFFIMAASYVLFAAIDDSVLLTSGVNSMGCHFMSILMWTLCVYLIKHEKLSPNWVFTWTTGSYIFGQFLGAIGGNLAFTLSGSEPSTLYVFAIIMVFIILSSSIFMLNNSNLKAGWGMIKPGEEVASTDSFVLACGLISREYELTPREEEIFVLLARGRNKTAISEILTLSRNTVKTHMQSVYQKTNVHSQQELMNLAEKKEASFLDDDAKLPRTAI